MGYKLLFDDKVSKDLKKIDKHLQKEILEAIKTKFLNDPYIGKKLVGDLSSYYRYGVSDYRIIYEILEDETVLVVIKIKHRKDIYK
ncbi:MAG: type II toxin-antitoxin system mRNA interferase toxin, RelE/StbE family [Sulfurimonas sp.]|nr:MAG: type II toxin-antitoxin system mRNA interferase toxin, RelE/StbE family [Sulfurimonas sp.]